jgi:hypothetical protein
MWVVMMAGMMIPSVAPMVLAHAGIVRRRVGHGAPFVSSGLFLAGYLLAWSGFSAVAALAQWGLYHSGLLDGHSLTIGPPELRDVRLRAVVVDQAGPCRSDRSDRLEGRHGRPLEDDARRSLARDLVH